MFRFLTDIDTINERQRSPQSSYCNCFNAEETKLLSDTCESKIEKVRRFIIQFYKQLLGEVFVYPE